MLKEQVTNMVDRLFESEFGSNNLIIHCYLNFLESSLLAGNIFICRYRVKFLGKADKAVTMH